jgi:hypothetical protein
MARVHGAEMKRRSSHELSGLEPALTGADLIRREHDASGHDQRGDGYHVPQPS